MFEAVFPFAARPAEHVVEICLIALGVEPAMRIELYEQDVDRKSLLREAKRRQHFDVKASDYRLGWGGVRNHNLAFLTAGGIGPAAQANLLSSLTRAMPLITARQYDGEYEHWQNAEDPLEYTAVGRSMDRLPMRGNDLPPPLYQEIVDTSRNPGRRRLRDGYVEAIGYRMWLGPEFFLRVPGASREAVTSASFLEVTERNDGILELAALDEVFVDDRTADLQNRLRRLLFSTIAGG